MTEKLQNLGKPETQPIQKRKRERGVLRGTSITVSHGSGGKAMSTFIEEVFATAFHNGVENMEDAAKSQPNYGQTMNSANDKPRQLYNRLLQFCETTAQRLKEFSKIGK